MLYRQRKYLRFLLKANNQHGVHSPFVYQLITQCFYKKTPKNLWRKYLNARQEVFDHQKKNKVTAFAVESKVFKNNERPVSNVVNLVGISNKKAKILIKTISYFKPKNILEIGTSLDLETTAIKIGNKNAAITTLESCPKKSIMGQELFEKNNFNAIEILNSDFSKADPKYTQNKQFDCVFFDRNQTKQATLNYFEECLKTIHNDSIFIFDAIYWTAEIQEAWSFIKKHPKVTVTIDVFYFGIVFFRKEQEKEHFKIRV
jgi:predicted O-methyltransferase YrrM